MEQTTVQNSNTIRFGSGKVEVGDDVGSLVNLGAMQGVTFEETWDKIEVMSDNAGVIEAGIRNHRAAISGDLMEIELENLSELRGGLDNYSTSDGSSVTGETQTESQGDWSFDSFIKLENQNGDGSAITASDVTDVSGGTDGTLSEGDDYFVGQNAQGESGIFMADDSATNLTTESQDITITYDYTPAASQTLKSGGKQSINPKVIRITNEDENGNVFQITIFKATTEEGITIELPSDDAEEPATTPINLQGTLDEDRTVGEQLFEIYDEQGVA